MTLKYNGKCLCGEVRFTAVGPPLVVAQCHCEECRRLSGTGHSIGAMFRTDAVVLSGKISEFTYQSGKGSTVTKGFCATCGSPIYGRNTQSPDHMTLSLGAMDNADKLRVGVVIFARDRPHWDHLGDDVPSSPLSPIGGPRNDPGGGQGDPRGNLLQSYKMSDFAFVPLSDVAEDDIVALMTNPEVGKQMPLLAGGFSREICRTFLDAKKRMWEEHGYGPWAFLINGEFAGWGGLQPEQGDADFALVLHPRFWGWGRKIFAKIKNLAFTEMGLESFTVLFPPSRLNARAIARLGFVKDGQLMIDGAEFMRYRLNTR